MLEKVIEKESTKHACLLGWRAYKASSPGKSGQLDHIYHKRSFTFYIEYKATGEHATSKQRERAKELRDAGIVCRCFDNIIDACKFIDEMTIVASRVMHGRYSHLTKDISSFD